MKLRLSQAGAKRYVTPCTGTHHHSQSYGELNQQINFIYHTKSLCHAFHYIEIYYYQNEHILAKEIQIFINI